MISLASLKRVRADKPPRSLIYGPQGVGKSTLASEFPDSVWLQTEDGTPGGVELDTFGKLSTYADVVDALGSLYNEPHDFRHVVLDSATALSPIINQEACERGDDEGKKYATIEEFPYGKGPSYAMRVWDEFLIALDMLRDDRGMGIVIIAHSVITDFKDPLTATYNRYAVGLPATDKPSTNIRGRVTRDMDAVIFLNRNVTIKAEDKTGVASKSDKTTARVRATGGFAVMAHTSINPAYDAKNRYGMPDTIRIDIGKGYAELSKYFPAIQAAPVAAIEHKEAA